MAKPKSRGSERTKTVFDQVTAVGEWDRLGHFSNDDEARGAFKLAHRQWLDGLGTDRLAWMGMTSAQFDAWMREDAIPKRKRE